MKIIKITTVGIMLIIISALALAAISPKSYSVKKDIIINVNTKEVFDYIKPLKNEINYLVMNKLDPKMERFYHGTDGSVGFVYGWKSSNERIGKGEKEIIKITEGKRIDYEFRLSEPMTLKMPEYKEIESISDNKTKVTWGFTGEIPYPMNLIMLITDNKEDDAIIQDSLLELKKILENKVKSST